MTEKLSKASFVRPQDVS